MILTFCICFLPASHFPAPHDSSQAFRHAFVCGGAFKPTTSCLLAGMQLDIFDEAGVSDLLTDDTTVNDGYTLMDKHFSKIKANTVYNLFMDYNVQLSMCKVSAPI